MTWVLHIANAQHQFGDLVEPITTAVRGAQERCESVTELLAIDVIVQAMPGRVIPERGYVGYAPTGTIMQLTFDPANVNLEACLGKTLERTIAHEFHYVLQWRGPGYSRTLGEALVSEGLAGWFAGQLYGEKPEPRENALLDVARRLKTLRGLTPSEFVIKCWTEEPDRFRINPTHHTPRPYT